MITGSKKRRIKDYMHIDHRAEGFGFTRPAEGEEIWGVPYQWHSDNSYPFIEHIKNGVVVETVTAIEADDALKGVSE